MLDSSSERAFWQSKHKKKCIGFYRFYTNLVGWSGVFPPFLLELPSSLWGGAEVSRWTQTEACPLYPRGVCCVRHSSSPSASPEIKPRDKSSSWRWNDPTACFMLQFEDVDELKNANGVTLWSSWFFSSSWASICRSRSSKFPWRSSA